MFLFDWFITVLQYFGFMNKKCKLLIIGLDNAGKSTLLSKIKDGRLVQHPPTNQPWSEELMVGKVTFQAYDLGGHASARRVWRTYFPAVDGIVFIVDGCDIERLPEARAEITGILTDEMVSDVPILILGNKIDKRGCYGKEQLIQELGINMYLSENVNTEDKSNTTRPCTLVMSSVVQQIGYGDGFRWMAKHIQENDRTN
ncbi:small COPII coat GTPase SAR1-like [Mytilus edulis]|uniref:small COPII coat GTPase SAR1-like n=1 Tax=Mytilus edulis TaxID=6550 RepID=UPI0039EFDBDC